MAYDNSSVEIEGISFGTFGKALKFQGDDWDEAEFLPLSQIEIHPATDSDEQGRCSVTVPKWLAKKNGWI